MSNLFNPDNAFFSFMGKAFDMLILNVVWVILCIPIVTIVPATTAMYYSVVKVIRKERSYALKEFWRSFKMNIKQGSVLSIFLAVAVYIMFIDFQYAWQLVQQQESSGSMMFGVFFVIALIITGIVLYLVPVLSRFEMKLFGLIKTAFFMSTRHLPTTILLIVLWLGMALLIYLTTIGIFFFPVIGILLSSFLIERVFKKYMPKKDEVAGEEEGKDLWYLD